VQLAVDLGIPPQRIETIISRQKAQEVGAKNEGSGDGSTTEVLSEMAELIASGQIEIPIAATYPLGKVRDAYAELEKRHTRGKIVLIS
jgi:NADPH:quinone reductase-like Zn-dependent oxidoreductase